MGLQILILTDSSSTIKVHNVRTRSIQSCRFFFFSGFGFLPPLKKRSLSMSSTSSEEDANTSSTPTTPTTPITPTAGPSQGGEFKVPGAYQQVYKRKINNIRDSSLLYVFITVRAPQFERSFFIWHDVVPNGVLRLRLLVPPGERRVHSVIHGLVHLGGGGG